MFWSSPVVVDGIVYIGCIDGYVYALNASTGAVKWASFVYGSCTGSSPAVVNGRLYIGTAGYISPYDGNVTCLNATTGALIWNYTVSFGIYYSSPAVFNDVVYIGTFIGSVLALDATTGALLSSYSTFPSPVNTSPAVANGLVYVGSGNGNIYALDASNLATVIWSKSLGAGVYASPVVAGNGIVYAGADNGKVFALDATTGAEIWTYQTEGIIRGSFAVVAGSPSMLYTGSYDGKVYAIFQGHDVAVTNVRPLTPVIGQGYIAAIMVTVENLGGYTETFNLTAYYDGTPISIEQGFSGTQSDIFWSVGDVNRDGYIDYWDKYLMVEASGWSGPPGTNPADINSDGVINLMDFATLASNYGQNIWAFFGISKLIQDYTTVTLLSGHYAIIGFRWNTTGMAKGSSYTISAYAWPVQGEEAYTDNNRYVDSTVLISKVGDFGTGPPVTYFACDGQVTGWDLSIFIMCYNELAPPEAMYLGDLGSGPPPSFFACDGFVDGWDLNLFIQCYNDLGPPDP